VQPTASLIKRLERISNTTGHSLGEVFKSFLTFAFCALSALQREEMYLEEAKRWKKEQLNIFAEAFHALHTAMETHPYQDLLGNIRTELLSPKSKQYQGEYYTPQHVCLMSAKVLLEDTDKIIKILEPACGRGRMILARTEVYAHDFNRSPTRLRVQAWDVNRTAVMMTFINTTLWGIPCWIIHGDTLRMKVHAEYPNLFTRLCPWPREEAKNEEPRAETIKTINLGKGHEQTSLFELDEAAYNRGEEFSPRRDRMTLLDTTPEPQSMRGLANNLWNDLVFTNSYFTFHPCDDGPGCYVGYKGLNERESYVAFRISERRSPIGKHTGWKVTQYDFDNRTTGVIAESYHATPLEAVAWTMREIVTDAFDRAVAKLSSS
jgi:hypothetical protein